MSRIITRCTRGRITLGTTKKVLVLAVAGILYFSEEGIQELIKQERQPKGGVVFLTDTSLESKKRKEDRIKKEDEEILLIIKTFLNVIN